MPECPQKLLVHIVNDKKEVVIGLPPPDYGSGSFKFTLDQFTAFISSLGAVREQMVAGGPIPTFDGLTIPAVLNPIWHIQIDPLSEGTALTFYHPSFGPLGFVIPREQISEIVRLLKAHLCVQHSPARRLN